MTDGEHRGLAACTVEPSYQRRAVICVNTQTQWTAMPFLFIPSTRFFGRAQKAGISAASRCCSARSRRRENICRSQFTPKTLICCIMKLKVLKPKTSSEIQATVLRHLLTPFSLCVNSGKTFTAA